MSPEVIVRVQDLRITVRAGGQAILTVPEVVFRAGDRVGIVGPSGSGKTVFVLTLLGLLERWAPGLRVEGRVEWGRTPNSPGFGVGYVPQGTSGHLNPFLPVGRQITDALDSACAAGDLTRERASRRGELEGLLEQVGLSPARAYWRAYPHQLSGGMQQRVALVMALAVRPRLLLLDEPTTALDGLQKRLVYARLAEVAQACNTALVVLTHDAAEIRALAREKMVIESGTLRPDRRPVCASGRTEQRTEVAGEAQDNIRRERTEKPPTTLQVSGRAAATAEPVLVANGLEVYPGGQPKETGVLPFRLRDIELRLFAGERLGVFGPSGSGKTTLVRALAGLLKPARGRVLVFGKDINALRPHELRQLRARFQVCFQSTEQSLNPFLTVRELLAEPAAVHRFAPPTEREVAECLEALQLPNEVLGARPRELSYGQRQRVALGRLLFFFPSVDLFLFDEPFAGFDAPLCRRMIEILQKRLQGKTCVIASHDHSLLDATVTQLICLQDGAIVEQASNRPWNWKSATTNLLWQAGLRNPDIGHSREDAFPAPLGAGQRSPNR